MQFAAFGRSCQCKAQTLEAAQTCLLEIKKETPGIGAAMPQGNVQAAYQMRCSYDSA